MGFGLLFPAALAALAALIVPLVIHIARRSEQLPTDFAALRWLRQKPRPRSRLRFDEWPLLLVRLLLLALLALLLARPVLWGAADDRPYVAVLPGAQFDPAAYPAARLHWLAPGFPNIDAPEPHGRIPVASLIRQLDADLPQSAALTIVTPRIITGADADRIRLSRSVKWEIQPGAMPQRSSSKPPGRSLSVRHDEAHKDGARYLRAVADAWQLEKQKDAPPSADLTDPLPDHRQSLAWLAAGSVSQAVRDWVSQGGTLLLPSDAQLSESTCFVTVWRDEDGLPLGEAARLDQGYVLRLTRPLRPDAMPLLLDADFPLHLRAALYPASPPPDRVAARDYAPMTGARAYDLPPQPLAPWLALIIALLFGVERWLASRRSRSIAP
ncbi:BatA domain-containing protein [Sphingobium soli]|uniref:BatA domain-containing protein n=1 Tax=Sphingobium soli TaxID=1591116 RepID=A0ABS8H6C2_9SPHN|nr:BatA domain-containing protein [Sphingobium soli]MCC4233237.1 BatA domain-containing protein [Sphingobium soli]